ncbi:MAG: ABC transporter ATP-binding protein [Nitrospira sp.]|nr:MAG: ABC transporter ATP-binding protein [Nitrospira sp.]
MEIIPSPLLDFVHTSKTFVHERTRAIDVLKDISFSIRPGEVVSLLGPSGCGKTTLLRMAAGLEKPTTGTVLYQGNSVEGPERHRGIVFQSYNAFPWLTVRENVAFGLGDREPSLDSEKVTNWLRQTGLAEFADSYPKTLSGGMRQRVALARTMIVEPRLLLLDEPFGALDERTRQDMQLLLMKIVDDTGCTVLFVTHGIREAILLSHRIVLLSQRPGRILDIFDSPLPQPRTPELIKTPEFMALYDRLLSVFPM